MKAREKVGALVDAPGEEGVKHPGALMWRASVFEPGKAAHQGAGVRHGNALAELFVQLAPGAELPGEHGEKLALEVWPEIGSVCDMLIRSK